MNYIKEVNAFRNYLRTNPIPAIAQALWYAIIDYHNHSNWEPWITIDNLRLMADLQISKGTLIKHRNILIQNKLLLYKSIERKKHMGKYSLISLTEKHDSGLQSGIKIEPDNEPEIQTGSKFEPDLEPRREPDLEPECEPDVPGNPHCEPVPEGHKLNKTKLNNIIVIKKENKEKENWVIALDYFCKKSGKSDLQLKAREVEAAQKVCNEVPTLTVILGGIDKAFDDFKPDTDSDKINSFKYCVPVIKKLYTSLQNKNSKKVRGEEHGSNKPNNIQVKEVNGDEGERLFERAKKLTGGELGDIKCKF